MPGSHQKCLSRVGVEKKTGEPHSPVNDFSSPEMCLTSFGSKACLFQTHSQGDTEYSPCWLIWHSQLQLKLTSIKCSFISQPLQHHKKPVFVKLQPRIVAATVLTAVFVQVRGMTKRGLWKQRLLNCFSFCWLLWGCLDKQQRSDQLNKVFCF